jgi:DNA processing protein
MNVRESTGRWDEDLKDWIRLALTPGVGPVTARKLLNAYEWPSNIWTQPLGELRQLVGMAIAQALMEAPSELADAWSRLTTWLDGDQQRHALTWADADYPPDLLQIPDPPLVLYAQGDIQCLHQGTRLAMVGSRNPTAQGLQTAHDFARHLASSGVCIVSGMALGVDGAAHAGALDGGGQTVGVVGTGLDRVYPSRHRELAHRVVRQGVLVSEFPLGTQPLPANFPKRNRLIAGLSQGTLVVEAALASGSLITARCAVEMGKDVMAIPGSIHSPQARGCHALIRQGAKLVETAQDVLEELRWTPPNPPVPALSDSPQDRTQETSSTDPVLQALAHDPVGLDVLQARTGWPTDRLQAHLLEMELDGLVARLPGGMFQRVVRA